MPIVMANMSRATFTSGRLTTSQWSYPAALVPTRRSCPLYTLGLRHRRRASRNTVHVVAFRGSDQKSKYASPSSNTPSRQQYLNNAEASSRDFQERLYRLKSGWDRVENKASLALYTAASIVVLYVTSNVLDSVDRLPILPGLFKATGLVYTGWFTWRYLLFKAGRRDLSATLDEIKQALNETSGGVQATAHDLKAATKEAVRAVDHKVEDTMQHMMPMKDNDYQATLNTSIRHPEDYSKHDPSNKLFNPSSGLDDTMRGKTQSGGQQTTSTSGFPSGYTTSTYGARSLRQPQQQQQQPNQPRVPGRQRNEDPQRNVIDEDI